MTTNVKNTIEFLKDRNNILPYATAQGFCYTSLMHFAPSYRPNYKRYFFPFRNWKHYTFYQIDDIRPYFQMHMTDSTLRELNLSGTDEIIAIVRVIVAGLTERQCDHLAAMDNTEMESLLQGYKVTILDTFDIEDKSVAVRMNGVMGFDIGHGVRSPFSLNFEKADWDMYDLNMEYPQNNLLIFTLNVA